MSDTTRILLLSSGSNALDTLKSLLNLDKQNLSIILAGVVTQPDRPAGRGKKMTPTVIKGKMIDHDPSIPLFQPENINSEADSIFSQTRPDLLVVVDYGQFLKPTILNYPEHGCLNIHYSLLPKYRGARPYQAAILNGDSTTGVTIQLMAEGLDEGDIIAQEEIAIDPRATTATLLPKLSKLGAKMLVQNLPFWLAGTLAPVPQDHSLATYTYKDDVSKEKAHIDWTLSALQIDRQIRAFVPKPIAWATWNDKRMMIHQAVPAGDQSFLEPGRVRRIDDRIFIGTGTDPLELQIVQLEGKNRIPIENFLNGYSSIADDQLT